MPRLTVILSSYNRPAGLRAAIASVLAQTFRDLEVIVCDDASTNAEVDRVVAEAQDRDDRVRYIVGPACSPEWKRDQQCTFAALINRVIRTSDSEFLSYLTDDCVYQSTRCEWLIRFLDEFRRYSLAWGQQAEADGSGIITRDFDGPGPESVRLPMLPHMPHPAPGLLQTLPRGNFIDHSSALHFRAPGVWWDEAPEAWTDLDRRYWLALAREGSNAAFLSWVHGEVKTVGDSNSIGDALARGLTIADVAARRTNG